MDISVITYLSKSSENLAPMLLELFVQAEGLKVELIVVDGGCMTIDFEKVGRHCREHGIEFSTVRQDPMHRHAPGYRVATRQARGRTLVFLNMAYYFPPDFLSISKRVGEAGYAWLPRAWMNVVSNTTECWGFWSPPDGMTLVAPAEFFYGKLLDDTDWSSTPWAKADAYVLASRLARAHPGRVGMAVLGGMEHREWMSSTFAAAYMPVVERDWVDIGEWILSGNDIRRFMALGARFEEVADMVTPYVPVEQAEPEIRRIVLSAQARHRSLLRAEDIAPAVRRDLDAELEELMRSGSLVMRPELVVEPASEGGQDLVRVRSTGNVFLPFEHF